MRKGHTTLTIDNDVIEKAKSLGLNISGEFQKFLEKMVLTYEGDIEGINLELLNIDIVKLKNQKLKIDLELQSKLRTKEQLEAIIKQKEQDNLQKEKEAIESSKHCKQCNKLMLEGEKSHKFSIGQICNSCFMNAKGEDFKRWSL